MMALASIQLSPSPPIQGTSAWRAYRSVRQRLMPGLRFIPRQEMEHAYESPFPSRVDLSLRCCNARTRRYPMGDSARLRILIVDDHPIIRFGLRAAFQCREYVSLVSEAASGEQALATLATQAFDFVLLDLRMPGLS